MGGKLTEKRVHMTRIQLFHLMQWIEKEVDKDSLPKSPNEVYKQALQVLGDHVTYYHVHNALKELNLIVPKKRISKEQKEENELLVRIKRLEKFIALNFPEEWGNL